MESVILSRLYTSGVLSPLDIHFARLLGRLNGRETPELSLAAAMVSSFTRQGHICLDLGELRNYGLEPEDTVRLPAGVSGWQEKLHACSVVGSPGEYKPLVLDTSGRLYMYRYWEYQHKLAQSLKHRIDGPPAALPTASPALKDQMERLFPASGESEINWQKVSALAGIWKQFCVISGGPGTGKTTTVAKLLAILIGRWPADKVKIALAAPTGKAAARLQEAIKSAKEKLDLPESIKDSIPDAASTIHRLLGSIPGTPYFRHNESNPLPADIVVIDEASMVDLALMSKLVQALSPQARLILLGDKDQLASVEAGAVLGDICDIGEELCYSEEFLRACENLCGCRLGAKYASLGKRKKPKDSIVQLQRSYRFSGDSGIALLSRAVRDGDADTAMALLKRGGYKDVAWRDVPSGRFLGSAVRSEVIEGFRGYLSEVESLRCGTNEDSSLRVRKVFDRFDAFRILCAVREGLHGVAALNAQVESILKDAGILRPDRRWYVGRPVLIGRNDYNLKLFNGDIGIFLPDMESGGSDFRVFFPGPGGRFRSFHPMRLPEHETVYAMTVHKSQGSEFDNVLFILPERATPVLTRELIYTAITRSRHHISLLGSESVLRAAITQSTRRLSGLSDALWRSP